MESPELSLTKSLFQVNCHLSMIYAEGGEKSLDMTSDCIARLVSIREVYQACILRSFTYFLEVPRIVLLQVRPDLLIYVAPILDAFVGMTLKNNSVRIGRIVKA